MSISKAAGPLEPEDRRQIRNEPGLRYDKGKLRWDLLPWDALAEVVRVLMNGAGKYDDRNWELGMSYSRVFACTQRHLAQKWWQKRQDFDEESGIWTLAHAACDVLFLLTYQLRRLTEYDDRPRSRHASAEEDEGESAGAVAQV